MTDDLFLIVLFFIFDGAALIALGIPLLNERVPPNVVYGFRTKKTLSDEKIWYAVNRAAGKDMIAAGSVVIMSSLLVLLFGEWVDFVRAVAVLTGVVLIMLSRMVLNGFRMMNRM